MLDVDNDEDLPGLLNCISRKDEMVMKCIEQEFGEVYDNEIGNFGRDENENQGGFYSAVESDYKEPKGYRTMLKRPPEEREKWLEACTKELRDFVTRGVWRIIKIHQTYKLSKDFKCQ